MSGILILKIILGLLSFWIGGNGLGNDNVYLQSFSFDVYFIKINLLFGPV